MRGLIAGSQPVAKSRTPDFGSPLRRLQSHQPEPKCPSAHALYTLMQQGFSLLGPGAATSEPPPPACPPAASSRRAVPGCAAATVICASYTHPRVCRVAPPVQRARPRVCRSLLVGGRARGRRALAAVPLQPLSLGAATSRLLINPPYCVAAAVNVDALCRAPRPPAGGARCVRGALSPPSLVLHPTLIAQPRSSLLPILGCRLCAHPALLKIYL
ncbi:MAG: hypothetical protein J3K34DRAFT_107460 [Monoraphidium minutum]|nr:MAG: hypothetical protein J3K34DRAFT_107460 [Monoraphidium minutum]